MARAYTNFAKSTLAGSIIAGDLALAVAAGEGALFPAAGAGTTFDCVIFDTSGNREVISVTARATDAFTIVRAQEGTTARAWNAGDRIGHRLTAAALNGIITADKIQAQSTVYCGTAGGTANALTLTPSPAITAYAAGMSFLFKVGVSDNSGAATVNISALGNIALQANYAALTGSELKANRFYRITLDTASTAQIEAVTDRAVLKQMFTAKGDIAVATAAGVVTRLGVGTDGKVLLADSTQSTGVAWVFPATARSVGRNVAARTNAATPNTKFDVSADEIVVKDTNGASMVVSSLAVTVNMATTGAAGLDTGAQAANTWYYGWAIAKADGTVSAVGSTSATAPTMPAGYTFKALVTALRSNGATQFVPYRQVGDEVRYESQQTGLGAGAATVETAVSLTSVVPPNAQMVRGLVGTIGGVADGGGNLVMGHQLRVVSGSIYAGFSTQVALGPGATFYHGGGALDFPNVSQNFYYIHTISNGTVPNLTLTILGFTLPVGGK